MKKLIIILVILGCAGWALASGLGIDLTLNISTGGGAGGAPPSGGTMDWLDGNPAEWIDAGACLDFHHAAGVRICTKIGVACRWINHRAP